MSILIACLLRILSSTIKISSSELLLPTSFLSPFTRCCFSSLWLAFCRRLSGFLPASSLSFLLSCWSALLAAGSGCFLRCSLLFGCLLLFASRRLLGLGRLSLWFSCSWCLLLLGSWGTAGRGLTWSRALVSCGTLLLHDSRVVMMHRRRTVLEKALDLIINILI